MNLCDCKKKYVSVRSFFAERFNLFQMASHAHSDHEIVYITEGKCDVLINNNLLTICQNQFILISEYVEHKFIGTPGYHCKMLCIRFECHSNESRLDLGYLRENCFEFDYLCNNNDDYIIINDTSNLCYAMKDYISELEENNKNSDYLHYIMLSRVLIGLARSYHNKNHSGGLIYINKAKEFIVNNLTEDLTVQIIANIAGINASYLQVLFQKQFSCGVKAFVNIKRLEFAKHLLVNTTMSVTQIAFETGFNSRHHFSYMFNKHFSQSPMSYRKIYSMDLEIIMN